MIITHLLLALLQDPTPQNPPPQPPATTAPVQEKPARTAEDRLEGRIAGETPPTPQEPAKPEPEPVPEPAPPPAPPVEEPSDGWQSFNSLVLIVNEEPVTKLEIQRGIQQRIREQKNPKPDLNRMRIDEIEARTVALLEIQGGKDLGYDPVMISRFVEKRFEDQIEMMGSLTKLAEALKAEDLNSTVRREEIEAGVYRKVWTFSVTGLGAGPGGRVSRDQFVRPGLAQFNQREAVRSQDSERTVSLTQILMLFGNPVAPGAAERIKAQLEDLRARIENGEDMGELAEQVGNAPKGSHGLARYPVEGLRKSYAEVSGFLGTAKLGDLSPVLPVIEKNHQVGWILIRLEEFKLPAVEGFDTPANQQGWIEGQRRRIKNLRIREGLMELARSAYVWPPTAFRAPEPEPEPETDTNP
ncbi:MAG TPA: hypothetical protein VK843_20540 [Planctomycetota bacterium]|nr:hypothetical protein [Planctomycetota bacterium]